MPSLDELRQKRMKELAMQRQLSDQQGSMQMDMQREQEIESQIKVIINKILTPEARSRLSNIRTSQPEYARQLELLLIQLAQAGQLPKRITDQQLKEILTKFSSRKKETTITRK